MRYVLFLSFLGPLFLMGQSLHPSWQATFGGAKNEQFHQMTQTRNGWLVAVGTTNSTTNGRSDGKLLILESATGALLLEKKIGGEGDDKFYSVVPTPDGGFLLGGERKINDHRSAWLVKVDEEGNVLWEQSYEAEEGTSFQHLELSPAGHLYAGGQKGKAAWLVQIKGRQLKWEHHFAAERYPSISGMALLETGALAICGPTRKNQIWFQKIGSNGDLIGTPIIVGEKNSYSQTHHLKPTYDGGFVLAGLKRAPGTADLDMWLIKSDSSGQVVWEKSYGGHADDLAGSVIPNFEGGFNVLGLTKSHQRGARDFRLQLLKIDAQGEKLTSSFPLADHAVSNPDISILQLFDGSLCLGATMITNGRANSWIANFTNPETALSAKGGVDINCRDFHFIDSENANSDGVLNPGERGYIGFTLDNNSITDLPNVRIEARPESALYGVNYSKWQNFNTGYFPAGSSKNMSLPVKAQPQLKTGFITFVFKLKPQGSDETLASFKTRIECIGNQSQASFDDLGVVLLQPDPTKHNLRAIPWNKPYFPIKVSFFDQNKLSHKNIKIYINGLSYDDAKESEGILTHSEVEDFYRFTYQNRVKLEEGDNLIEIAFVNSQGEEVKSEAFSINYSAHRPNLHLLAIGVPQPDLQFTAKDAQDFSDLFKKQEGILFNKVFTTTLNSPESTRTSELRLAFEDLRDYFEHPDARQKISSKDFVIIFISSHGKIIKNRFKILSSEYYERPREVFTLDYENDIITYLDQINCKKLLFIDACHSGAAGTFTNGSKKVGDLLKLSAALNKLNLEQEGISIISSCRSNELSFEDENWENGAFTQGILDAFSGQEFSDKTGTFRADHLPDNYGEGVITIEELYQFLQRYVPDLVRKNKAGQVTQTPFMPQNQLDKDLPVFYIDHQP